MASKDLVPITTSTLVLWAGQFGGRARPALSLSLLVRSLVLEIIWGT